MLRWLVSGLVVAMMTAGLATAQSAEETAYIKKLFAKLQLKSFLEHREYCGFLYRDSAGRLQQSVTLPGTRDRCTLPPTSGYNLVATYHTHGAFDPESWGEVPSTLDVESDTALGTNGWVATPGGRLWYIDPPQRRLWQVCGVGCLAQAPGFYKGVDGHVAKSYTFDGLRKKLGVD